MLAIQLQERIIERKDWATVLFVLCVGIIVVNKTISSVRFNEFIRLAYSDKYTKIYKDSSNLMSGFTVSMFVLQLFSFSFFTLVEPYFPIIEFTSSINAFNPSSY